MYVAKPKATAKKNKYNRYAKKGERMGYHTFTENHKRMKKRGGRGQGQKMTHGKLRNAQHNYQGHQGPP